MSDNGPVKTKKKKRAAGSSPVPGLNLQELIQERNWPALAGLALIAIALLQLLQRALDMDFNLWSLLMLGLGGWLVYDSYQTYEQQNRTWADNTRNRAIAGGVIALIGLMGMFAINWWGLMLLAVGGWLGMDTYQQVERQGGVWTRHLRNRMFAGVVIGTLGLFSLVNIGSAWSLILIVIGALMLCRHFGKC